MKLENLRGLLLLLAMVTTLSLTYAFMNVRSYETLEGINYSYDDELLDSLLPPPVVAVVPPPPSQKQEEPVKQPQKENPALLDLTDKKIEPKPIDEIKSFDPDDFVEGTEGGEEPLDTVPKSEEPRYFASQMPYFSDCVGLSNNFERHECTKHAINRMIKDCFQTPDFLVEMNFAGNVAVQFIVNENGNIENIQVLQSDHELLNKPAINSLRCLPQFQPGEHNGQKVKVIYQQNIRLRK